MITTAEDMDMERAFALTIARQLKLARRYIVEVQAIALQLQTFNYCAPADFIREAQRCQLGIQGLQSLLDIPTQEE